MTPLERLGLVTAGKALVGDYGAAMILAELINANGRFLSAEYLSTVRSKVGYEACGANGVRVRVCRLRAALLDVGAGTVILTAPYARSQPSAGYSLPEPGRSAVIARLIEEAETC